MTAAAAVAPESVSSLEYRWALELGRPDGLPLGQVEVSPDWNAAREWTRFVAARRGVIPLGAAAPISPPRPEWHSTDGAPFVSGFALEVAASDLYAEQRDTECRFPTAYFSAVARQASAALVTAGALQVGEKFVYLPVAFARDGGSGPQGTPARAALREMDSLVPVCRTAIEPFLARGAAEGPLDGDDVPLFVPQSVVDEVTLVTRAAPDREVGGILIGLVHRNSPSSPSTGSDHDLFLEVTAQVTANAAGDGTSLSFTADTWTDVRAAIALRNRGEIMLGWWHSHIMSVLCKSCPIERQHECSLANGFLSDADSVLHGTVFPRAYSVALVMSLRTDNSVTPAMFGWRHGLLARRSVHVLDARRS